MSLLTRSLAFASLYASGRAVLRARPPALPHLVPAPALPSSRRWVSLKERERDKERELPRNEDIPFTDVQIRDPETGRLGNFEPLADLLNRINKKETMVQLAVRDKPIVVLVDRRESHDRKKAAREKEKAQLMGKRKTIRFTWGISSGDLDHKMKQAIQALEKRSPVDIVMLYKKKQEVDREARAAMERNIKQQLSDLAIFRKSENTPNQFSLEFDVNPAALKAK
ncbi:hypothetical protein EXIGLDRAFT_725589 [Exidia glandulosa HHB12029]|uniref:Translation initiation factor 3 N-terminal domain-containing protein n=1 Tax=Exidia glandulosa HHB12029 TaxID=1314781 RepID=A0A165DYH6_EXIGL|nr:hypothetical protein EXIGLDRAFT_725589 [Exidia glandulosa HHB12029]